MKTSKRDNVMLKSDRRILLFDLALGGHHGNYIKYLIDYWYQNNLDGNLDIVVMPEFLQIHTEVTETISKYQHPKIQLIPINQAEAQALNSRKSGFSRLSRNLQEWQLFCQYALKLQTTDSLIMYLDTCEIPLALGKSSPCPFSGIYFRPTFHYPQFANYKSTRKEKLQQIREKITLSRILKHPQLKNLFCLDPFAVKHIKEFSTKANIVYLPDPIAIKEFNKYNQEILQQSLGIEQNRKIFLLFGALDGRKGIYQLIDAIYQLPDYLCQKLCLLLVGGTNPNEQANIKLQLQPLCQSKPIQIIERYEFIPESAVFAYFQLADVILAPYQKHVGMSGILLLAASADKPVLSSNYGLMGEMVRKYQLGLSIDSTNTQEIAQGLIRCLTESSSQFGDFTKMQTFAKQNSSEKYASTIWQNLGKIYLKND
jgi:glycosyltransferase involved in cell wall biosynthesis